MKRWIWNIACLASLLLAMGVAILWAGSYRTSRYLGWAGKQSFAGVLSMAGELRFERATYGSEPGWSVVSYPTPPGGLAGEVNARDRTGPPWLKRLGIASAKVDYTFKGTDLRYALYVPHWLPLSLTLLLPAAWTFRRLRRPPPPGHCPACGYDLRATPGRCPECGRVAGGQPA